MWPKQREVAQKEACQTKDTRATGQQRKRNTCPPSRRDVNALHCACCSSFCCRSRLRSNTARQLPCRLVLACLITPSIAICTAAALDQTPPCRRLSASFWHVLAILACLVPFLAPCLHRSRFRSSTFSRLCGRLFFLGCMLHTRLYLPGSTSRSSSTSRTSWASWTSRTSGTSCTRRGPGLGASRQHPLCGGGLTALVRQRCRTKGRESRLAAPQLQCNGDEGDADTYMMHDRSYVRDIREMWKA